MPDVRTPLATTTALELGHKLWRKQIIREGKIAYKGGEFDASPEYLDSVVASFRDKAIGSVPFVFVDDKGAHSEAPERRKGKVVGLERTAAGIDALLQLSDDAERLVEDDPEFGVSVLIKHDRTTGEGKFHPAVLCHVAGTYDPVLALQPWAEELAASHNPGDELLDLLALTAPPDTKEQKPMADADTLTPEELAQLRSLLAKADAAAPGDDTPEPEKPTAETAEVEKDDDEDAELAAMVAGLDDAEPELLAASNGTSPAVLALTQRLEAAEQARKDDALQLAQLRDERDESHYLAERENLARTFGIHPSVTDLIKPLLKGGGSKLALANGAEIVPADLIRKFVHELATRPRLDLSQTKGHALDLDNDEDDAKNRDALAAEIAASLR